MMISLLLTAMASSASAGAPQPMDADAAARVGARGGVAVYDFEDDSVEGQLLKPDGANIGSRGAIKHASMITIRPHFIVELIQMTNDV